MKRHAQQFALFSMLAVLFAGCGLLGGDDTPPKVSITHPTANAVVGGMVTLQATASDDDAVERVEFYMDDQQIGASTAEPWTFAWNTLAHAEGAHALQARAYDPAGNEGVSETVAVTVGRPFQMTFNNEVFTPISITVAGQEPRSIPAGESTTYYFDVNPGLIEYEAETSGETSEGGRIGSRITWDYTHDVSGRQSRTLNLVLTDAYFFLYMRNDGGVALNPLYVNYGLSSQTRDDIVIPPDGLTYRIGYYRAYTNTQVRAYRGGGSYTYWNQGTHFRLPFTQNQSVTLRNTHGKRNGIAGYGKDESYVRSTNAASVPLAAEALGASHRPDREGDDDIGTAEE